VALTIDAGPPQPACVQPAIVGDDTNGARSGATQLALELQNPISSLIGLVILENNTNFNIGPYGRVENTLNIQPIFPVHIGEHLNIVSRTVLPVVWLPKVGESAGETFGLSDSTQSFFFTPAHHHAVTWGVGPVAYLPTATSSVLGTGHWGIGPTGVFIVQPKPWTIGLLASHVWSIAGPSDRPGVSASGGQLLVAVNLANGWYVNTSPFIASANWKAGSPRDIWTIPVGGGIGKVFRLDGQPVNMLVGAYWNVVRPRDIPSPAWQLRVQLAWLLPR
jgi:hypothetical protein